MDEDALRDVAGLTYFLDGKVDEDPQRVAALLTTVVGEAFGGSPTPTQTRDAAILMNAAGVVINAACRTGDVEALMTAEGWMTSVIDSGLVAGSQYESAALYNLANCQTSIADIRVSLASTQAPERTQMQAWVATRFADHERLRLARQNLKSSAMLLDGGLERSTRWCNLANTLDHSGRWIEAYDAYVRALREAPSNGNAAGNAAVMISRVIGAGWDYEGHLCNLYDQYLRQAKDNRAVTVAVAGEAAAQRYDHMELTGTDIPPTTPAASGDPYLMWIASHRLALAAALEDLGSSSKETRWDTIGLNQVSTKLDAASPPLIFAMLNVLKADFLVARRLAYEAEEALATTDGWAQHPTDPGVYADTLNYAVYGEVSSKLILAHRAALDVLDKTAVAVNEHLQVGDNPKKVSFRKFWFEDVACTQLRSALIGHAGLSNAILSLAELAIDMAPDSLYGHAQLVRNAGTHRFITVHLGITDVESSATMQAITLETMRETCIEALTVARAAFIYLVELLRVFESNKAGSTHAAVPLFLPEMH
ncbi:hypothetical protein NJBCHELONAE_12370 [Mycobacteroides chelonae]|uniref:LA2681 family HEPN domain-containing protein n=1 Tax=Mycobacteroides chelonae TaxID=1774 RepID=UPI0021DD88A2|nr:LA2681 family HEPN domain-containing protein [Mycobacteroides chelonae]GLE55929.1 hypothetical protein NJBCHELONAE_12370 [Mycobacteroides chelonae]